jgi:hypothetical protein
VQGLDVLRADAEQLVAGSKDTAEMADNISSKVRNS